MCANKCRPGKYGGGCRLNCECYNNASCHHVSGHCTCQPGFKGDRYTVVFLFITARQQKLLGGEVMFSQAFVSSQGAGGVGTWDLPGYLQPRPPPGHGTWVLTPIYIHGCQASGTRPTGMLSCLKCVKVQTKNPVVDPGCAGGGGASTYYLAKCLLKTPHISKKYWTKREWYASLVPLPDPPLQPLRLRTPGDHYILNNNDTM